MNKRVNSVESVVKTPPIASVPLSDLSELFLAARRQAWIIAVCGMLGLFLGAFHYATSPREFMATSTILIEERQIDLDQEIAATAPVARSDSSVMNQIQILQSLTLAEEVVATLDLTEREGFYAEPSSLIGSMIGSARSWVRSFIPRPVVPEQEIAASDVSGPDRAVTEAAAVLRNRTRFERVGRSFVVEISYVSHDPALATAIVNAYAEAYLSDGTRANVEASSQTAEWMQTQVEQLRQAAREAAESIVAFRSETGSFDQQGQREREYRAAALNELLSTFEQRYQEIAIESTFPVLNGRILSRALPPRNPSYPSALQLFGAGLLLGLFGGLIVAVRREGREVGFRTAQDVVRTLDLPFLGYVPPINTRKLPRSRPPLPSKTAPSLQFASARAAGKATDCEAMKDGPVDEALMTLESHHQPPVTAPLDLVVSTVAGGSAADRAFRKILTVIDPWNGSTACQVIAVGGLSEAKCSAQLASNLAAVAARAGKRTLLVDGDLLTAELSHRYGAENGFGLMDAVHATKRLQTAIRGVNACDMNFLPAGLSSSGAGGASRLNLDNLDVVVSALRSQYDCVVIALPPMDLFPETMTLLNSADTAILVARWGGISRRLVEAYVANEPDIRRRLRGVVLTETTLRRLRHYGVTLSDADLASA